MLRAVRRHSTGGQGSKVGEVELDRLSLNVRCELEKAFQLFKQPRVLTDMDNGQNFAQSHQRFKECDTLRSYDVIIVKWMENHPFR